MLGLVIFCFSVLVLWVLWLDRGPFIVGKLILRAKRTPYYHLEGYMERYWLLPFVSHEHPSCVEAKSMIGRWLQRRGVAIRIHRILRSDSDWPHDHPWTYITGILPFFNTAGYIEERYDSTGKLVSTEYHGPGSILWRRQGSPHRLILPEGRVWTIFITFRKTASWGFLVDGKKVPWREHLGQDDSVGRP